MLCVKSNSNIIIYTLCDNDTYRSRDNNTYTLRDSNIVSGNICGSQCIRYCGSQCTLGTSEKVNSSLFSALVQLFGLHTMQVRGWWSIRRRVRLSACPLSVARVWCRARSRQAVLDRKTGKFNKKYTNKLDILLFNIFCFSSMADYTV